MSQEQPRASFISFYSFKGGVGRSMALINTAGILAGRRGFRVLIIDLDLEAPGISYLNPNMPDVPPAQIQQELPFQPGFVDLLSDAKERGEEADLFVLDAPELAKRYTKAIRVPEDLQEFKDGSLHIMSAGRFDESYPQRFDSLDLGGLYRDGLGEPLIRVFKKKFGESGLYDYVLVDSRTGFSDEAGICTRDLADHLMVLSGLNRQNVEGTCAFLRALRAATNGEKTFQIILSPVPNGEDALFAQRETSAKENFKMAWGKDVDVSLQIPYHPQLALTEEPHIFRSRRGYLYHAYCAIESSMLEKLGHNVQSFRKRIRQLLDKKNYSEALHDLQRLIRLDGGKLALSQVADDLMHSRFSWREAESEPVQEENTLSHLFHDDAGRDLIKFIVEWFPVSERSWTGRRMLAEFKENSPELAEKLFTRMEQAAPNDADLLGEHASFLNGKCGDLDAAEMYYKRAIEADPEDADHLGSYAIFLNEKREDLDAAEMYYKRAIEADSEDADHLGSYAIFLNKKRGDFDAAEMYYKRAIEADPEDADHLGSYAIFLNEKRGDLDAAEMYYKRAIEADSEDSFNLWNYTNFLSEKRGDIDTAEMYYKRAIKTDPKDANTLCDYGQFLSGLKRLPEAEEKLLNAFKHRDQSHASNMAEMCFALWLVLRMREQDAICWERRFKFLIQKGFKRHPWNFDRMLSQAENILAVEELRYAEALAAAFLDENKVPDLEKLERWRVLEPLDPNDS